MRHLVTFNENNSRSNAIQLTDSCIDQDIINFITDKLTVFEDKGYKVAIHITYLTGSMSLSIVTNYYHSDDFVEKTYWLSGKAGSELDLIVKNMKNNGVVYVVELQKDYSIVTTEVPYINDIVKLLSPKLQDIDNSELSLYYTSIYNLFFRIK